MSLSFEGEITGTREEGSPSETWFYDFLTRIWTSNRSAEDKKALIDEKCATALVDPDVGLSFAQIEAIRDSVMKGE